MVAEHRAAGPRAVVQPVAGPQVVDPRAAVARQVVCLTPGAVPLAVVRAVFPLPGVPRAAAVAQDLLAAAVPAVE